MSIRIMDTDNVYQGLESAAKLLVTFHHLESRHVLVNGFEAAAFCKDVIALYDTGIKAT